MERWLLIVFILFICLVLVIYYAQTVRFALRFGSSESGALIWKNHKQYGYKDIYPRVKFVESNIKAFTPLSPDEKKKLQKYAKTLKIDVEELEALRHMILVQKTIDIKKKMKPSEVLQRYEQYPNLKFFDYKLPPLTMTGILKKNGIFVDSSMQQYAMKNDFEQSVAYGLLAKKSEEFENKLASWLRAKYPALKFKTQKELTNLPATPDILFDEPTVLRLDDQEHLIRWMDAKNFTLIQVDFTIKKLTKQSERYVSLFGPGAFVFHYGFDTSIHFANTLILDASFMG